MKPKNNKEKYRKKCKFGTQKLPKMDPKSYKKPIIKNDWKIWPTREGGALLDQGEVTHTLLKGGTLANTVNKCAADWLTVANAHAVLASPCTLKSPTHHVDALPNAANSFTSDWPDVANAHAVLAMS